MIRLDQLSNRNKFLVILFVVVPLFIFIFYDMSQNTKESTKTYFVCNNGTIIEINENTTSICGRNDLYYNKELDRIEVFNHDRIVFERNLKRIINKSLYTPD